MLDDLESFNVDLVCLGPSALDVASSPPCTSGRWHDEEPGCMKKRKKNLEEEKTIKAWERNREFRHKSVYTYAQTLDSLEELFRCLLAGVSD